MNMKTPRSLLDEPDVDPDVPIVNDQNVDFSEYMWMAEELEDFDRQVEMEFWEEAFIEACFDEMMEEEEGKVVDDDSHPECVLITGSVASLDTLMFLGARGSLLSSHPLLSSPVPGRVLSSASSSPSASSPSSSRNICTHSPCKIASPRSKLNPEAPEFVPRCAPSLNTA